MKKIRILALILALLMLSLGMLVSCEKDKGDDEDEEEGGGSTPNRPTTGTTTAGDDGVKSGYLCYYTFDNAPLGTEFSPVAPYTFFFPGEEGRFVFGRRGRNDGYLGIERSNVQSSPYYNLLVKNLGELTHTHVVSFDIFLGGEKMKESVEFIGRKDKSGAGIFNTFLTFNTDGSVVASRKYHVYDADPEGEWVNFAIAINDRTREFDVYVGGVKTNDNVPYYAEGYEGWDVMPVDLYRIVVSRNNSYETELRVDNVGVSTGLTPPGVLSNVVYTDVYAVRGDVFKLGDVDKAKQTVLDIYTKNDALLDAVKTDLYSSKLLMCNAVSLAKVDTTIGTSAPLQFDYGVETGAYNYGGKLGGKTFYSETGKIFELCSDVIKDGDDKGKLIVVDEKGRKGTYSLSGDDELVKITIIIDNVTTYAVYSDGVFKTVSDNSFNPEDKNAIVFQEGAFHGKTYSYHLDSTDGVISITFTPNEIKSIADFSMQINDTVNISQKDITYAYNYGILTFNIDETEYTLAYNKNGDDFTLYNPDNPSASYTLKPPAREEIKVLDTDTLALQYKGVNKLALEVDSDVAKQKPWGNPWEKIYFKAYVPENMAKQKFELYLFCNDSNYYSITLTFNKAGVYETSVSFSDFKKSGNPSVENLSKIEIRMNDSMELYLINIAFIQEKMAVVESPKAVWECVACQNQVEYGSDKNAPKEACSGCGGTWYINVKKLIEDCTHKDNDGNSYLDLTTNTHIEATCESIGYYAIRCTNCQGTAVNQDMPIEDKLGHDLEEEILTHYPSCGIQGYTYQICSRCNYGVEIEKLEAKSHEYHEILNNAVGRVDYRCKHCGDQYSTFVSYTLMHGKDKYSKLPEGAKSVLVYKGHNDNVNIGSIDKYTAKTQVGTGDLTVTPNYGTFVASSVGVEYAFELKKGESFGKKDNNGGTEIHNPYIDLEIGKSFGAGGKFIFEFDIQLGAANVEGKYGQMMAQFIDRSNSYQTGTAWIPLFKINENGVLTFDNDGAKTPIKLSAEKMTNVAIIIDPVSDTNTVYIDGFYKLQCKVKCNPGLTVDQIRIGYDLKNSSGEQMLKANAGTSYYFNHIYAYQGTTPVCLVNPDAIEETKGNEKNDGKLNLYDVQDPVNNENAKPVTEISGITEDTTIYLNNNTYYKELSSDYTFSFTLSTSGVLADGVLLKGNKVDGFNVSCNAELLSVNGGYLYYMGVPIHKLAEAGEDIVIKLYCEDYLSRATVTVNGKDILVKRAYSTDSDYLTGNYADKNAYLRSYTFCAGSYTVKDISFKTTVVVAEK